MTEPRFEHFEAYGWPVTVDLDLGHLWVEHDGTITWDQLQAIKTLAWGSKARAIEVYPADDQIVRNTVARHLWRLGKDDFCPDLLGRRDDDSLRTRHAQSWAEASR
ncbi:hypothetical protein [Thalassococcus sp. S3]|uniref:DUF7694 domain-containing protein n=1 Tax=Thalassococcus sp. S3 TaxID=2017482 RepID=UPI001024888E|nr:hypothetical protein [Thalassococcus sp. S3]QBF31510.1 hypothetical protein CFI11_09815 [Thalassococcus sp. S3]